MAHNLGNLRKINHFQTHLPALKKNIASQCNTGFGTMTMWTQPAGSHCEALVCQNAWLLPVVLTFIVSLLKEASRGMMAANGNHEISIPSRSRKEM